MKIRSLQFKFLITVISAILIITIFVGGLSIYEVDSYLQHHTEEFVEISCSSEAAQVNNIFGDIENSVRIMESYVLSLFKNAANIKGHAYQEAVLQSAGELFANVAANTDGAVAYYLRFDPAISDNKTGMFYSKIEGSDEYVCLEPTDLSLYDKNDNEHVGWFWRPYEAGRPVWLEPYYNRNNNILMISFVIPLFVENQFIGVVGMDFNFASLTERVHQIKVFERGFAHLELNGTVIHSGDDHSEGSPLHDEESYFKASSELVNGMTLALYANRSDITQIRHDIVYKIFFTVVVLAMVFSLVVFMIVKKVVKPLKVLTDAAIKLSGGDYDVEIEHSNTYEIQQLSSAFDNMLVKLREHKKLQHLLAYRDSLTGLRNTTSYKSWVDEFDAKIKAEKPDFGVMVLDLNYLKKTNDTYGHDAGNKLIVTASQIISDTFKRSPVFRIGGDEFVVILQNHDLDERDLLFANFASACTKAFVDANNVALPVSVAQGFSMYDPNTDTQFADVFRRADDEMYKHKSNMKLLPV